MTIVKFHEFAMFETLFVFQVITDEITRIVLVDELFISCLDSLR